MQIKEVKPINFLFFRAETKLGAPGDFIPVAKELFKEAISQDLSVTGPIHWHYFGFTGDENKPFTLEIALPVSNFPQEYDGKFHFKRTEPFKCVSVVHEGSWYEIPKAYRKLMEFMGEHNLVPNAIHREVYVNADFKDPEANVTEIQMGVR